MFVALRVRAAATNRDLYEIISAGTFREGHFDRLSACSITWPPLRERRSDISHITDRLLTQINRQFNRLLDCSGNSRVYAIRG